MRVRLAPSPHSSSFCFWMSRDENRAHAGAAIDEEMVAEVGQFLESISSVRHATCPDFASEISEIREGVPARPPNAAGPRTRGHGWVLAGSCSSRHRHQLLAKVPESHVLLVAPLELGLVEYGHHGMLVFVAAQPPAPRGEWR